MSLGLDVISLRSTTGITNPHRTRRRPRAWTSRYLATVLVLDAICAGLAGAVAYVVRFPGGPVLPTGGRIPVYLGLTLVLPLIWIAALGLARAYDERTAGLGWEEFARTLRAAVGLTAVIAIASYAAKAQIARGYVLLALPLTAGFSMAVRVCVRHRLARLRTAGHCLTRVLIAGHEDTVLDMVERIGAEPETGMTVVGACVPSGTSSAALVRRGIAVCGDTGDVVAAGRRVDADAVAVTSELGASTLRSIGWDLEGVDMDLLVAPGLVEVAGPRLHIRPVTGLPLLHVEEPQLRGVSRLAKNVLDRLLAAVLLVLCSPLLIAVAAAVRVDSAGPVLFRQQRVGRGGRTFTIVKFRTMVVDAEARLADLQSTGANRVLFKMASDPRITRIGRVLRRYSLDELPQLVNVLTGSMSLVGPRPPVPKEVAVYGDDALRRLLVRPGLTGLWQVSGRADLTWEESLRLDLRYVENWSFLLDLAILWRTASAVIRGSGAY